MVRLSMDTRKLFLLAIVFVVVIAVGAASADRIVLKGGYEVVGELLKSQEAVVIVDIGTDVLRLPREDIIEIISNKPPEARRDPNNQSDSPTIAQAKELAEDTSTDWQLYHTAQLTADTIENNAERFDQAVIMVTCPGGQGSGFVISPDGYIITNYHVIARETRIKITVFLRTDTGFEQKYYKNVKIIALNPFVDLALLKIQDTEDKFKYVYFGDMVQIEAGQEVFAIGNPLGLTRTVSQGIVSTKNRNFNGRLYIQTTTAINPGNSGGPLFNQSGEVIGVTSMGYLFLGGLNFAIPVDVVKRFIDNRDAFAYDEDNPNEGFRYLQPSKRQNKDNPPAGKLPWEK